MHSTILNPFTVGGALSDPDGRGFYGRDEVFAFVRDALRSVRRVPILLQGQRRIGKSSILRQLQRHLPTDFVCVYFDLQGKATMNVDQVLYGLGRAIADRLELDRPAREECTEDRFPEYLDRAAVHLGGRLDRLVLLFDEFDVIDQGFTGPEVAASRFIPYLAELSASYPAIGYVLVVGRKIEELSLELFGSILKDSVSHVIGRLNEAQTARLVTESSAAYLRFEAEALADIYHLTCGHPFCVQVLCHSIWNAAFAVPLPMLPVPVTSAMAAKALPAALQSGSLGLNWVYDGMSQPVHKVVLSALAEAANPVARESASLDTMDRILRRNRIEIDPVAFGRAPHELVSWDVLVSAGRGFAYAVPMIGAWIRENRTLAELQQKTVLANPRAQRYYELALESLGQDNYDASIEDFRNALAAQPRFVESLRGLADALHLRRQPGDLRMAVEAYERILDLNADEPHAPFRELLADSIAQGGDIATIQRHYERLKAVDQEGGPDIQRASRALHESATTHAEHGTPDSLAIARTLSLMLEDTAQAARMDARLVAERRLRMAWMLGVGVAGLVALFLADQVPLTTGAASAVKGLFAALAGSLFALSVYTDDWGGARWRFCSPVPFVAVLGGAVAYVFPAVQLFYIAIGAMAVMAVFGFRIYGRRPPLTDRVTKKPVEITNPNYKLLENLFESIRSKRATTDGRED